MEILLAALAFLLYITKNLLGEEKPLICTIVSYVVFLLVGSLFAFRFFPYPFIVTELPFFLSSGPSLVVLILTSGVIFKRIWHREDINYVDLMMLVTFGLLSMFKNTFVVSYVAIFVIFLSRFKKLLNVNSFEALIVMFILMFYGVNHPVLEFSNYIYYLVLIAWLTLLALRMPVDRKNMDYFAPNLILSFCLYYFLSKNISGAETVVIIGQGAACIVSLAMIMRSILFGKENSLGVALLLAIPFGVRWEFCGLILLIGHIVECFIHNDKLRKSATVLGWLFWLWVMFGLGRMNLVQEIYYIHAVLALLVPAVSLTREVRQC